MKKFLVLVLSLTMCVMTACGSGSGNGSTSSDSTGSKYVYVHKGETLTIGEAAQDVLGKLGEYTSHYTSESCAFQGLDHFYVYGTSLLVGTSIVNKKEVLTTIQLLDDLVATPEGIRIGDSDEKVANAYGAGTAGKYTVKDGKTTLAVVTKDGEVISITYSYAN